METHKAIYSQEKIMSEINSSKTLDEVNSIANKYIGKKGEITTALKQITNNCNIDEIKKTSIQLNELKDIIKNATIKKRQSILDLAAKERLLSEKIDLSMPSTGIKSGSIHPINMIMDLFFEALSDLGFKLVDGPEIDDDFNNFEALNTPAYHPARQMQATFYVNNLKNPNNNILRTQTSNVQVRTIMNNPLPIRCFSFGKVYRVDWDATHTPMFHQVEGLLVDKCISIADLKFCISHVLKKVFEKEEIKIKFRPSYFPFTSPSIEVDIFYNNNWIEVLGCGMIHENVLKKCKVNLNEFNGFAFGIGIERIAMIKYELDDIRLLFDSNIKFLNSDTFNLFNYV